MIKHKGLLNTVIIQQRIRKFGSLKDFGCAEVKEVKSVRLASSKLEDTHSDEYDKPTYEFIFKSDEIETKDGGLDVSELLMDLEALGKVAFSAGSAIEYLKSFNPLYEFESVRNITNDTAILEYSYKGHPFALVVKSIGSKYHVGVDNINDKPLESAIQQTIGQHLEDITTMLDSDI